VADATLRPATPDDLPAIVALLAAVQLPPNELEDHLDHVVVAEADGRVVGCGGLEVYPGCEAGLVRSMAVEAALQGSGLGARILAWVEEHARSLGVRELFLFTMNARDFYARYGYQDATLEEFPECAGGSAQYRFVRISGKQWGIVAMRREA
jgi:N-acetylglutamate synthase-like GNAT family acetyltransferase